MTLIILDGPDCTGKTTFAHRAKELYPNTKIIHSGYERPGEMWQYNHDKMLEATFSNVPVIMDRSWISEEIYGHVYRGRSEGGYENRFIHRLALTHSAVYVLCIPRNKNEYIDFYHSVYDETEELYPFDEKVTEIWQAYNGLLTYEYKGRLPGYCGFLQDYDDNGHISWTWYDFLHDELDKTILECVHRCEFLEERQVIFEGVKGHLHSCDLVIVYDGDSIYYLTEMVHEAWLAEERILWVPVSSKDADRAIIAVLAKSKVPSIVTMGQESSELVSKRTKITGVQPYTLNHPDWFKQKNKDYILTSTLAVIARTNDQQSLSKSFVEHNIGRH